MIVVPYIQGELQPETEEALVSWPGKRTVRRLEDDTYGYWQLIKELWYSQADICLIEQDNAPTIEQLRSLEECQQSEVCGYSYVRESSRPVMALGMLRWRGSLSQRMPWLLDRELPEQVSYDQCDGMLHGRFLACTIDVHNHGQAAHFRRRTMLLEVPVHA